MSLTSASLEALDLPLSPWLDLSNRALMIFSEKEPLMVEMNRYGQRAKEMWAKSIPMSYQELVDNGEMETFFTDLGEQVANRIEGLSRALISRLPKDLSNQEHFQESMAAQRQAEEVAMTELVYDPVGAILRDAARADISDLMGNLPSMDMLWSARWDVMSRVTNRLDDEWEEAADRAKLLGIEPPPEILTDGSRLWKGPGPQPLELVWYREPRGWHPTVFQHLYEEEIEELEEIAQLEAVVGPFEAEEPLTPEQEAFVRKYVAGLQAQGLA
jgi:hypothetical protein